jgi:hypothetical protein
MWSISRSVSVGWIKVWAFDEGRPCVDCGGVFHPEAMHFDHRRGTVKEFDVAFGTDATVGVGWWLRSRDATSSVQTVTLSEPTNVGV